MQLRAGLGFSSGFRPRHCRQMVGGRANVRKSYTINSRINVSSTSNPPLLLVTVAPGSPPRPPERASGPNSPPERLAAELSCGPLALRRPPRGSTHGQAAAVPHDGAAATPRGAGAHGGGPAAAALPHAGPPAGRDRRRGSRDRAATQAAARAVRRVPRRRLAAAQGHAERGCVFLPLACR
jgi:hypothetical protein